MKQTAHTSEVLYTSKTILSPHLWRPTFSEHQRRDTRFLSLYPPIPSKAAEGTDKMS